MRILTLLITLAAFTFLPTVPAGSFKSGSTTCPTSGTKQVSSTQIKATWVNIQAPAANTTNVYVGDSGVTSSKGTELFPNDSTFMPPVSNSQSYDLSNIYFACTTNTDAIKYTYQQ